MGANSLLKIQTVLFTLCCNRERSLADVQELQNVPSSYRSAAGRPLGRTDGFCLFWASSRWTLDLCVQSDRCMQRKQSDSSQRFGSLFLYTTTLLFGANSPDVSLFSTLLTNVPERHSEQVFHAILGWDNKSSQAHSGRNNNISSPNMRVLSPALHFICCASN